MARSTSKNKTIGAVLFDIGGVLLQLDYREAFRELGLGAETETHAAMTWLGADPDYDAFERGRLSEADYHRRLVAKLPVRIDIDRFRRLWNGIIGEPYDGVPQLLATLARRVPIYALSNSNVTHIDHVLGRFPWFANFREVFSSHHLGVRKPTPEIYALAQGRIGVPADQILFFDDRRENVEAASACGMNAMHVASSPDDLIAALDCLLPDWRP